MNDGRIATPVSYSKLLVCCLLTEGTHVDFLCVVMINEMSSMELKGKDKQHREKIKQPGDQIKTLLIVLVNYLCCRKKKSPVGRSQSSKTQYPSYQFKQKPFSAACCFLSLRLGYRMFLVVVGRIFRVVAGGGGGVLQ
jgi:hypothetical protein